MSEPSERDREMANQYICNWINLYSAKDGKWHALESAIADAIAAAREEGRREVLQWRPIETAPKDGTIIDVWLGGANQRDVDFYCCRGTRRAAGWHWLNGKFRPANNEPVFAQPTHWLPLPPAPEDAA